jgi:transcription elongation GreA/GreB family factor
VPLPDKPTLRAELLAKLAADLETLERAHRATREGATHEEAKPENDKDTRALEQSYLARGQATRIEALRADVATVRALPFRDVDGERVVLGSLVHVEEDGDATALLLAPAGGGARLAEGRVLVVTPSAPLGRGLVGKRAGEVVEIVVAGKTRTLEIVRVR